MIDNHFSEPDAQIPDHSPSGFATFWGVRHSPFFGRVDVPAHLLLENQRSTATRVLIAAQEGAPVVSVGGRDGAGSTLLARWLYDSLPESTHHAMLLAPGAAGTDPSALTSRIADFGRSKLGVAMADPAALIGPVRGQLIALAPVFDALRNQQKRLALIFDNAGLLSGEPWAAYILAVIRQGELIDGVVQFFLFGHEDGLHQIVSSWPKSLEARAMRIPLSAPSEADQARWIENRLILAGCDENLARSFFSRAAIQRAISASGQNLTRLGKLAERAMIEAFMSGSRQVEVQHVASALGQEGAKATSVVAPSAQKGMPGLMDLLKPI